MRAAVAVELVHAATLVHDDVLDAAALRRGRPTVVATAGREIATATGDLLFARAFAELAAQRRRRAGPRPRRGALVGAGPRASCCSARTRGTRRSRSSATCARCELKTARLFEAACGLGALEAGGDGDALGAVRPRDIGLAFQILDDVLDVSGPAERTGKHRGTDLLDGTVTLPFILAREPTLDCGARPARR